MLCKKLDLYIKNHVVIDLLNYNVFVLDKNTVEILRMLECNEILDFEEKEKITKYLNNPNRFKEGRRKEVLTELINIW